MDEILVVAEKPSVARDIARVLGASARGEGRLTGGGYVVTWAIGHLVALREPEELDERYRRWRAEDLPILPERMQLKVLPKTRAQFSVVKKLMNSREIRSIICATDSGREGELIFRYIYEMAGCQKPVERLWISSMTDEAIRAGRAEPRKPLRRAVPERAMPFRGRLAGGHERQPRVYAALRGAAFRGPGADAHAGHAGHPPAGDRSLCSPAVLDRTGGFRGLSGRVV